MTNRFAATVALRRSVGKDERLLARLGDADDADSLQTRAIALWRLGSNLKSLGRFEDALPRLQEAEALFRRLPAEQRTAMTVASDRAVALIRLDRYEEARNVLEAVLAEVGEGRTIPGFLDSSEFVETVMGAVRMRLMVLEHLGRTEELRSAAERVIRSVPGDTDMQRAAIADAFLIRGVAARERRDWDSALLAFEASIAQANAENGAIHDSGVRAKVERVEVLADMGRGTEALTGCTEIMNLYRSSTNSSGQEAVSRAKKLKERLTAAASG